MDVEAFLATLEAVGLPRTAAGLRESLKTGPELVIRSRDGGDLVSPLVLIASVRRFHCQSPLTQRLTAHFERRCHPMPGLRQRPQRRDKGERWPEGSHETIIRRQ